MCGCWNKRRGSTWGPRGRGAPEGGGRALCPHGQMVGPPGVFSVPDILKYSTKNHFSFSGHLENFHFRGIFIARIMRKTDKKYYFALFNLNNRK